MAANNIVLVFLQIIYVFASMLEPDNPKGWLILYALVSDNMTTNIRGFKFILYDYIIFVPHCPR